MPRTRIDLVTEVLDLLGVTQTGQDPAAEDADVVDRKADTVLASLAAKGVVYVLTQGPYDDAYFDALAVIIANNAGPKFGQSYDPSTDAFQEATLRSMQREPGIRDVVRADYF